MWHLFNLIYPLSTVGTVFGAMIFLGAHKNILISF